ncbi:MAG: hypothetical protein SF029_20860 [bacterium]|nr:hypothetical protein [bacterium]
MAETTADREFYPQSAVQPERLAWGILLIAFAIFCFGCAGSVMSLHWFFFQSSLPLNVLAQSGRGTLGVSDAFGSDQSVRARREMSPGMAVRTDTTDLWSQGTLTISDNGRLIALVTLKSDTSATLWQASQPRFEWMSSPYQIDLTNVVGDVDVYIAPDLQRDIEMTVRTHSGIWARLGQSGSYGIRVTDKQVRLMNYSGEALLVAGDGQTARSIAVGQQGFVEHGTTDIQTEPLLVNLIRNSTLAATRPDQVTAGIPDWWACGNGPNNVPRGQHEFAITDDGRPALHLVRGEGATTNGMTFCEQNIGSDQTGIDVAAYNFLEMRVSLNIRSHSLSACGTAASECPLMMRITYQGEDGGARDWYQGIYAYRIPNDGYPNACDSCRQFHLRIWDNVWYTYESGNLFDLFRTAEERPVRIVKVIIYASGHQYDVYVGNVSLVAGNITSTTPDAVTDAR